MKLGIRPERIQAGHPEQNGRHERMHRTLKQETASPPAATARAQQRAFDRFRRDYNELRPHEALDMQTPAAMYVGSSRVYPGRAQEPEYDSAFKVRRVQQQGQFRWKSERVFLGTVFEGERVGLLPCDDRYYTIYFAQFPIAWLDSRELKIVPLPKSQVSEGDEAGEEEVSPSPAPHPLNQNKVSGMSPV